jgi:hypothetical protein
MVGRTVYMDVSRGIGRDGVAGWADLGGRKLGCRDEISGYGVVFGCSLGE